MRDHYAVLGVDRKADSKSIRSAYERKMQKLSRLPPKERAARERVLREAFDTLSSAIKREDLDAHLVEIDANVGGSPSNTPLAIGIVVVLLTIMGVGYFLTERWKAQAGMAAEKQRAATEREKANEGKPRR